MVWGFLGVGTTAHEPGAYPHQFETLGSASTKAYFLLRRTAEHLSGSVIYEASLPGLLWNQPELPLWHISGLPGLVRWKP